MHAREARFGWQRGGVIALALLSLVLPVAAVVPVRSEVVPFMDPAGVNDHRIDLLLTVAVLVLGLVCAIGAFIGMRGLRPGGVRWLSVGLATLGLLLSAYLLVTLIGTCGAGVISGMCQP